MAFGPGKYDAECTAARDATDADGALLIIINGLKGSGFACQATPEITLNLPRILRTIAEEIERSGIAA